MSDGHFLFGVGAAKAGTTWLARALRRHPEVALPPMKETHYFDGARAGAAQKVIDMHLRVREAARQALSKADSPQATRRARFRLSEVDRWLSLIARQEPDDARYEWLMSRQLGPARRVVADVTPAYAMLETADFARMAALNGGRTKFLMILRDPVDRLWSNIRMTLKRRVDKGVDAEVVRGALLREVCESRGEEMARADYAGSVTRLDQGVAPEALSFVFFEDLFERQTQSDLAVFLGLSTSLSGPAEPVNSGEALTLRPEEREILRDALQPQYDFVQSRFGGVPARWLENAESREQEVA